MYDDDIVKAIAAHPDRRVQAMLRALDETPLTTEGRAAIDAVLGVGATAGMSDIQAKQAAVDWVNGLGHWYQEQKDAWQRLLVGLPPG